MGLVHATLLLGFGDTSEFQRKLFLYLEMSMRWIFLYMRIYEFLLWLLCQLRCYPSAYLIELHWAALKGLQGTQTERALLR